MTRSQGKPLTTRQLKVGEELRRLLAEALIKGEVFASGFDTSKVIVSEVRISPDFSVAKVFVSPLGSTQPEDIAALLENLATVKGQLKKILGEKLRLRLTPDLTFLADKSFAESAHIEALLARPTVKKDLKA